MYRGKRILGLITARGGSKGLPGKNIRPMLGKPLIAWTLEQALSANYFDKVIVSTDDKEIARIAKEYKAEVPFLRPPELASDEAKSAEVVFHALDFLENGNEYFDYITLLQPTSPLRCTNDIDRSLELLINDEANADSLVSLGEITHGHPAIIQVINEKGLMQPYGHQQIKGVLRQELGNAYIPYGVVFISKVETLRKYKTFYQERTLPYIIERWQHYEIDDIYDFLVSEAILKTRLEVK